MTDQIDRIPPHSLEAEQALLGAVLVDRDMLDIVRPIVRPAHFYAMMHEWLFEVMTTLHDAGQPIDKITVSEGLRKRDQLDKCGGISYLSALMETVQSASSARYYAAIVREKATLRALGAVGRKLQNLEFSGEEDVNEALAEANRAFSDVVSESTVASGRSMSQARARYQAALSGRDGGAILTPWDQLNNLTRGFTADEVVILASESKMGKSMWLGELILYVAWCYGQVEVFAAEMGEFKTYSRLLALISGISAGRQREAARAACGEGSRSQMFTLRESTRMASAMTYLDGLPITIHEDAMSAQDIVAHCRASNRRKKLRSVIVDTFGAVRHERVKGQAKTDSLEESIKALKFGAKEVQAPFFVAHHLNRGARTSGRPTADNLRDGGNLDGWASSVLFLHKENHEHMLIVDRCRDGTPGVIPNSFDGSRALWWETGLEPWHPLDFHQDELAIDDGSLAV